MSAFSAAIDVHATVSFDFGSDAYRRLHTRAGRSAFADPDWLIPLYAILAPALDVMPLVVEGRDADGELAFVVPLVRRTIDGETRIEFASLGVTDYVAPLVALDRRAAIRADRDLAGRFRDAIGAEPVLIRRVRDDALCLWEGFIGAEPQMLAMGAHAIVFGTPYREWRRASFGTRRAAELDRKARRLADLGPVRLDIVEGEEARAALLAAQAFRRGRFSSDPLQQGHGFDFYAPVATEGARSGLARTYRLSVGGAVAAVVFGLIEAGRFLYLLLGADYEHFGRCSPGMVALDLVMADWAAGGGTEFDFTIGDEPFKTDFGAMRTPLHALRCRKMSTLLPALEGIFRR